VLVVVVVVTTAAAAAMATMYTREGGMGQAAP